MRDGHKHHLLSELLDHPVEVELRCACTKVSVAPIAYLIERLGPDTLLGDVERRMRCHACKQRARAEVKLRWNVSDGRDMRVDPPPMPGWVDLS